MGGGVTFAVCSVKYAGTLTMASMTATRRKLRRGDGDPVWRGMALLTMPHRTLDPGGREKEKARSLAPFSELRSE
jgi:hypothetical protein